MSEEPIVRKRVDETWKEQAQKEKLVIQKPAAPSSGAQPDAQQQPQAPAREEPAGSDLGADGMPQARFDLFVSGLAMEALIALGEMPHPVTHRQSMNLAQARYLIDLLGVIEAKTKGNLAVDEAQLMKDTLYQLRMRYLSRAGAPASG
jgi:hypothetical protein